MKAVQGIVKLKKRKNSKCITPNNEKTITRLPGTMSTNKFNSNNKSNNDYSESHFNL